MASPTSAQSCDPEVDPDCYEDPYASEPYDDGTYGNAYAEDPYYNDPYYNDPYYNDPYSPTTHYTEDPYYNDPYYNDPYYTEDPYHNDPYYDGPSPTTPPNSAVRAVGSTPSAPANNWAYSRTDAVDAIAPTAPVASSSVDATGTDPDAAALHRSIAGRLVLATDALAELGAFARDEDPAVTQAIAEIARTVPSAGLDADGYYRELGALADELPLLLVELEAEPSDGLLLVTNALADGAVERLSAGDMAFIEPLPWLESIADVLMRGGGQLEIESEDAQAADEDAVVEFVSLFADPEVFQADEVSVLDVVASTTTTAPDLALLDADETNVPTNDATTTSDGLPLGLLGSLLAALVILAAGFAAWATRRRSSEEADNNATDSDDELAPASSPPVAVATLPIAPPRDEPGSLVELLDASRRMTASLDADEIAAIAVAEARNLVNAEGGLLLRRSAEALIPIASQPSELFSADDLESSVLRRVVDTGRTMSSVTSQDAALVDVPAAMAAVAIVANGSVIGALMVVRRPSRQFTPAELDALEMLAPLAGSALLAAQTHGSATALADLDALTGLANRRSLDRDIGALRPTHVASYVMIDVDHFKNFNDTNGHAAGDVALQTVARAIETNVRPEDRVYRYGGEEFCVLLPGASSGDAAQVAERVRAAVESADIPGGLQQPGGRVTISIGVADTEAGINDIIERADGALYEAKESGRNRVNIAGGPIV